jgi:UDP-N-acetylmuramoyl-L-alanyl-D-glutamate--2,6-diaminopimelate ligase
MRLSELISALPPPLAATQEQSGDDPDPVIRGLAYDSRAVAAGDWFFALRGADADGHDYLENALALGAAALAVEEVPTGFDARGRTLVVLPDTRRALAPVSNRFFGEPSNELRLIGITGTNGKTSVSYLLESILQKSHERVGVIGTVEIRYPGERRRSLNTTPESYDLQNTLRAMRTHGVETVVMEVSSHGLELGRVDGCRFALAAFTNLTQDHLDFHGDMGSYRHAKTRLFQRHLHEDGRAVINVDDPSADAFLDAARGAGAEIIRVSRDPNGDADVRLEQAEVRLDSTRARLRLPEGSIELTLPLVGDFNVENTLVACGAAIALGIDSDAIVAGIEGCPQVPGRIERIDAGVANAPTVFVDYAHTPDAVEKVLRTLRPLTDGRLVAVFGCGGDRDRAKRPLMAEAVARFADRIVATSDNPRTEDPERILADVEQGLTARERVGAGELATSEGAYAVLPDRREAIEAAVSIARSNDIVVVAGKGHEDYQIVGRSRLPFSDVDESRRALAAWEER